MAMGTSTRTCPVNMSVVRRPLSALCFVCALIIRRNQMENVLSPTVRISNIEEEMEHNACVMVTCVAMESCDRTERKREPFSAAHLLLLVVQHGKCTEKQCNALRWCTNGTVAHNAHTFDSRKLVCCALLLAHGKDGTTTTTLHSHLNEQPNANNAHSFPCRPVNGSHMSFVCSRSHCKQSTSSMSPCTIAPCSLIPRIATCHRKSKRNTQRHRDSNNEDPRLRLRWGENFSEERTGRTYRARKEWKARKSSDGFHELLHNFFSLCSSSLYTVAPRTRYFLIQFTIVWYIALTMGYLRDDGEGKWMLRSVGMES